jgi:hypothetical protein
MAVLVLASDESSLMTGSIVNFDQTVVGAVDDNPVSMPERAGDLP